MAEALGIASGIAGLASLSIEIAKGVTILKERVASSQRLPETVSRIQLTLDSLEHVRKILEPYAQQPERFQDHAFLQACRDDYNAIAESLDSLQKRTVGVKKRRMFRGITDSSLLPELESLHILTLRALGSFNLAMHVLTNNTVLAINDKISGPQPTHNHTPQPGGSVAECPPQSTSCPISHSKTRHNLRVGRCDLRACYCSCHRTHSSAWKYWSLRYTPMRAIMRACDVDICNARRVQFALRVQLSWLCIPAVLHLAGEFVTSTTGYSLRPSLGMQRVVRATSKGFELIHHLKTSKMHLEQVKTGFRQLLSEDPTIKAHVNTQGQTYITQLVRDGAWGSYGSEAEKQFEMIGFLANELQITNGLEAPEFLYDIVSLGWSWNLKAATFLLEIGYDFDHYDEPIFGLWPGPVLPQEAPGEMYGEPPFPAVDPFYVESIALIALNHPGFGGMHPIHDAVFQNDLVQATKLVAQLVKEGRIAKTNFLGQTAMHMALDPSRAAILEILVEAAPELNDQADHWGFTPLMYTAAMGYEDAARILIQNNACLSPKSLKGSLGEELPEEYDFISCCFIWDHSLMIWNLFDDLAKNAARSNYLLWCALSDQLEWLGSTSILSEQLRSWKSEFWTAIFSDIGPKDLNYSFGSAGKNLAHYLPSENEARKLIEGGFSIVNETDHDGEHCLFSLVKSYSVSSIQILLAAGADPFLQNKKGRTVFHVVCKSLNGYGQLIKESLASLALLWVLLSKRSNESPILHGDRCVCKCSEAGCLPTDDLIPRFTTAFFSYQKNVIWGFDCLATLGGIGKQDLARKVILSHLRRFIFERLGIQHTCECHMGNAEERPWEAIAENRRIEELETEMQSLQFLSFEKLEDHLFESMRQSFKELVAEDLENRTERGLKKKVSRKVKHGAEAPAANEDVNKGLSIDYTNDRFVDDFDMILQGGLVDDICDACWTIPDPSSMAVEYMAYLHITKTAMKWTQQHLLIDASPDMGERGRRYLYRFMRDMEVKCTEDFREKVNAMVKKTMEGFEKPGFRTTQIQKGDMVADGEAGEP